jgi:peptide chain release factor 1
MSAIFSGPKAAEVFSKEIGKHIVQRYPKNGKGHKHTSVVSVTVLPLPPEKDLKPLPESELTIECLSGIGAGGQNVQKNHNVIRMRHQPTGLQVISNTRDQHTNRKTALRILTAKVNEYYQEKEQAAYNKDRKAQVKTGRGGEKCRTYNYTESRVTDHRTGKKTRNIKGIMQGEFNLLD